MFLTSVGYSEYITFQDDHSNPLVIYLPGIYFKDPPNLQILKTEQWVNPFPQKLHQYSSFFTVLAIYIKTTLIFFYLCINSGFLRLIEQAELYHKACHSDLNHLKAYFSCLFNKYFSCTYVHKRIYFQIQEYFRWIHTFQAYSHSILWAF